MLKIKTKIRLKKSQTYKIILKIKLKKLEDHKAVKLNKKT